MKNDENKEQIIDPSMNTIFFFNLQKNNNYSNPRFGMQKCTYDMLVILAELVAVFTWS
jgi:hypothetical protein